MLDALWNLLHVQRTVINDIVSLKSQREYLIFPRSFAVLSCYVFSPAPVLYYIYIVRI